MAPPAWMVPRREFARSGSSEYMAARATYEMAHRGEWDRYVAAVAANPIHSNYTNRAGRTSLSYASSSNKIDIVEFLLSLPEFEMANEPDEKGWTALHHAVRGRHMAVVEVLLSNQRFTEVHARNSNGQRAIDLISRSRSDDVRSIAALLSRSRSPALVLFE